ncbi:hypothetical protein BKI52_19145 [marine bacterium AO1-C]|nr:hypothetical protein BKI52_19145 [marine bacterium AO1-C]
MRDSVVTKRRKKFITKDLYDSSEKVIFLTGKQRMFYSDYQVRDTIYAAKSAKGEWKLITETNFKTNSSLQNSKIQLDKYFEDQI